MERRFRVPASGGDEFQPVLPDTIGQDHQADQGQGHRISQGPGRGPVLPPNQKQGQEYDGIGLQDDGQGQGRRGQGRVPVFPQENPEQGDLDHHDEIDLSVPQGNGYRVELQGIENLFETVKNYARELIGDSMDDQVGIHDEALLQALSGLLNEGQRPTATEVKSRANESQRNMFAEWSPKSIAGHLRRFGLQSRKSHGQLVYGDKMLGKLREIEKVYGIELGPMGPTSTPD